MLNEMSSSRLACRNKTDVVCYICNEYSIVPIRNPITKFIKRAYHTHFGMKLSDQGKAWVPHMVYKTCIVGPMARRVVYIFYIYIYIYILSVYSPFSDRVGLPLHNTPFPGVLMKSIGTRGAQTAYSRHTCRHHHNSGNQAHP